MNKKRFVKITIFLILIAVFLMGTNVVVQKIKNSNYFVVKKIRINGIYNSDKNKVNKVAKKFIGKNIFKINLKRPFYIDDIWVEKIRISRQFPDKIIINIFEKKSAFIFKKNNRCYHYIKGSDKIRTKCKNPKIVVKGQIYKDYFNEFTKIFNTYNLNNYQITLYPSYFSISKNDYKIKSSYDFNTFNKNYYYFENAIKNNYKKINLVDLRINGKIFVNGVTNEAG